MVLKPPQVLVKNLYVSLFPFISSVVMLATLALLPVFDVDENWAGVILAPFMLAYMSVLVAGLSRGPIRLCFHGMGTYWRIAVLGPMLIFTLAITGLGSYWLGQSAFDVVGGYGFLALGLIFCAGLVLVLFRRLVEIRRGRNRLCPNCGYDRKGDLCRTACPECGYMEQADVNSLSTTV
jgi:hypothetical protein